MKREFLAIFIAVCAICAATSTADAQLFGFRGGGLFRAATVCESGMCEIPPMNACEPCEPAAPACEPVVPVCEPAAFDCADCYQPTPLAARFGFPRPLRGMLAGRFSFGLCCR